MTNDIMTLQITPAQPHIAGDGAGYDLVASPSKAMSGPRKRSKRPWPHIRCCAFDPQRLLSKQLVAIAQQLGSTSADRHKPSNPTAQHVPAHAEIKVISDTKTDDGRLLVSQRT